MQNTNSFKKILFFSLAGFMTLGMTGQLLSHSQKNNVQNLNSTQKLENYSLNKNMPKNIQANDQFINIEKKYSQTDYIKTYYAGVGYDQIKTWYEADYKFSTTMYGTSRNFHKYANNPPVNAASSFRTYVSGFLQHFFHTINDTAYHETVSFHTFSYELHDSIAQDDSYFISNKFLAAEEPKSRAYDTIYSTIWSYAYAHKSGALLTLEKCCSEHGIARNLTFKTVDNNTWKTIFKIK